jgi:hypothetical protein
MKWFCILIRLLALTGCFLLVACIDGREEYWLEPDGSGRALIHYEVPAAFAAGMGGIAGVEALLDQFFQQTPTLTDPTRQVTQKGDRLTVEIKTSFKSVEDLIAAVSEDSVLVPKGSNSPLEPLIGDFNVQRQGLKVDFKRTIYPARALPGSSLMPEAQLDGRHLFYILHLPTAANESNATRTEADGRTLIWDQPFKGGAVKKLELRFKADLPFPWRLIAGAAGGLVAVVCLIAAALRRSRRKRSCGELT